MEEKRKDLTWQDIRLIDEVLESMIDDDIDGNLDIDMNDELYYTEALKRYNNKVQNKK